MKIEKRADLGRAVIVAITLLLQSVGALMLSASPAFADTTEERRESCDRLVHEASRNNYNPLNPEYTRSVDANILRQMNELDCEHLPPRPRVGTSSSAPYVEPTPPPVVVRKFPDFDPQNPKNQQMMLMCAGTYAFFTSTSAETNPRDKAAYEAMLAAFQKSRGISKSAAEDLVSDKKWFYGGSYDYSRLDKSRGIEFNLRETEFGTFESNMADLADRALLCGNTLGIDKPSLIDKYLSAFYR
jgi:hypothetical protein